MTDVEIRLTRFGAPAARALVEAAMAELVSRYGGADANPVDAVEFDPPEGCFLLAWRDGTAVACGGWRRLAHLGPEAVDPSVASRPDVAEIKRMYAVPALRGSGIAAALLAAIEASAREHGMRRLVLETGGRQPEAIRFYEKAGYARIAPYGYYRNEEGSVCFARDL